MLFKIRELRRSKKMSQAELAKESGVSRATISGLENGNIPVTTTETLRKIADALGMRVGDIFLE